MKKWMIYGLAACATSLSAENESMNGSSDPCVPCEPCEPCEPCVPELRKCIDCVCYTAPYYDLQCDCGLFVALDFLFWYGKETNLAYAVEETSLLAGNVNQQTNFVVVPNDVHYLDAAWDPGARVTVGWNGDCDGWDVNLNWTWYRNKKSGSKSVTADEGTLPTAGGNILLNPWDTSVALNGTMPPNFPLYDKISSKWRFTLNNIDLEIGRRYYLSRCFTLRPFAALRGAWTKTIFSANGQITTRLTGSNSDTETRRSSNRFRNTFWGVGFLGGLEPAWFFTPCFSLFAGVDVALLWGEHCMRKTEGLFVQEPGILTEQIIYNFSHKTSTSSNYYMQPILDLSIGLRWEDTYCCDQYAFGLDAGWEHHVWFNLNDRYRQYTGTANLTDVSGATGSGVLSYDETQHDVSFGGFVLRARFDF